MARSQISPLAISLGDPAGIGPEVIAKCWDHRSQFGLPPFVAIGDGHSIAAVWDGVPVQRCTVHKHRNLLAHAPERLHEEIGADYTDMIYATTPEDIAARRKAFIRKWRLKHRPVADSLEEAGDRLFSFAQLPPSQ